MRFISVLVALGLCWSSVGPSVDTLARTSRDESKSKRSEREAKPSKKLALRETVDGLLVDRRRARDQSTRPCRRCGRRLPGRLVAELPLESHPSTSLRGPPAR
ncbi:MAG: hypothetical protein KC503_03065 [Myxococcales bacterium]|nr:hypothetical protein [Myxococcales bacterium]